MGLPKGDPVPEKLRRPWGQAVPTFFASTPKLPRLRPDINASYRLQRSSLVCRKKTLTLAGTLRCRVATKTTRTMPYATTPLSFSQGLPTRKPWNDANQSVRLVHHRRRIPSCARRVSHHNLRSLPFQGIRGAQIRRPLFHPFHLQEPLFFAAPPRLHHPR